MVDKVLQLEKEDKNQADLQAAHRAPIGSRPGAAVKGKEGKGNNEKKKGKGKGENKDKEARDRGSDSEGSSDSSGQGSSTEQRWILQGKGKTRGTLPKSPASSCTCYGNCKKGTIATSRIARQLLKKSYAMASRRHPPTTPQDLGQAAPPRTSPASAHGQGVLQVRQRMHLQP